MILRLDKKDHISLLSIIKNRFRLGQLLVIFTFLSGVFVSTLLGVFDSERKYNDKKIVVFSDLSKIQIHLEGVVSSTFNLTQGMVHYISHQRDISLDLFDAMIKHALQESRHIRNVALAPNNVVRWVYPLKGNERAIGLNYMENPLQRESVLSAQALGRPLLAGPVELVQGGLGFINRTPILLDNDSDSLRKYWGLVSVVAYVNTILEDGNVTSSKSLNICLKGKDGKGEFGDVIWGDSTIFGKNPVILDVTVPGGKWQLAAIPIEGWPTKSLLKSPYLIIGIINTIIISFFLSVLVRRNRSIRIKNRELAKEIAERKRIEADLILSKEAAESANRMKSAFLANMSHEIRTPMNSVLGFSDLLLSKNQPQKDNDYYLKIINSSTRQLLNVINDIIDISIIETGQLKIFNRLTKLNPLLSSIYQLHSLMVKERDVVFSFSKGLPNSKASIIIDDQRLSQVLNNLINNALKFTERGEVEFGYTLKGEFIEFYVKDTGKGIPEEYQELVFERFRQVEEHQKNTFGGTGLGLSISKSIVELMGGKIWLQSELNKGSQFYFTIPYHQVFCDDEVVNTPSSIDLKNKTILIAEDDNPSLELLEGFLKQTGVQTINAKNGLEAMEQFLANQHIDLIILDIKMPLLNGFDTAKEIRKINKRVPIIAQTAYAMAEDKEIAMSVGFDYYLPKPISQVQLLNILKKVFG